MAPRIWKHCGASDSVKSYWMTWARRVVAICLVLCSAMLVQLAGRGSCQYGVEALRWQPTAMLQPASRLPQNTASQSTAAAHEAIGLLQAPPATQANGCDHRFYIFTMEAVERIYPNLKRCGITVYANKTYHHLVQHLRRTFRPAAASLFIFPPYLAWETNWPRYGHPQQNMARQGSRCGVEVVNAALELLTKHITTRKVLLLDMSPRYRLPDKIYQNPHIVWAKLNHLESRWRPDVDVSMAPPPSHVLLTPVSAFTDAPTPGATAPKYFATFKGNFDTYPKLRNQLGALHNPGQGVVIVNTKDTGTSDAWDYAELLNSTAYTFVPRGDVQFSYRFVEAVCSGAVPVLLSDDWVPPFTSMFRFQEYGVHINETMVSTAVQTLRNINAERHARLQQRAKEACLLHMSTQEKQIDTMLSIAFAKAGACHGMGAAA